MLQFLLDISAFYSIYLILSLSLNLEFGYAGVPNFGKVLLVAGGAYVVAGFSGRMAQWILGVAPNLDFISDNTAVIAEVNAKLQVEIGIAIFVFLITLVIAALIGGFLGFLASYPAIRLREDYLGMTLLAIGEIARVVGQNQPQIAGGSIGVQVPDPFVWVGELRFAVMTLILIAAAALTFLYSERIARSPLGRLLRSVRDNEMAAQSLGKDTTRVRMKILVVGSAISALAGGLYAFYAAGVVATTYNRVDWTFWPWLILIIGGAANNLGVAAGSLLFIATRRLVEYYKDTLVFLPFNVIWVEYLILGGVLILVLIYRPEGLIPEKPTPTIKEKEIAALLKSYPKQKK